MTTNEWQNSLSRIAHELVGEADYLRKVADRLLALSGATVSGVVDKEKIKGYAVRFPVRKDYLGVDQWITKNPKLSDGWSFTGNKIYAHAFLSECQAQIALMNIPSKEPGHGYGNFILEPVYD